MAKYVGAGKTRRTNRRIARVRLANPNALPHIKADNHYTPREVRRVRHVASRYDRRAAAKTQKKPAYNPLAPLTGKRGQQEINAATQLQFGDQESELAKALRGNQQEQANRAQYYEDYKQALRESAARVKAANDAAVSDQQARTDQAYQQDMANEQARNAQDSAQAAKLGRAPVQSNEGAQAVAAERQQSNMSTGLLRGSLGANYAVASDRESNASLQKAEALDRLQSRRSDLERAGRKLKSDEGAFKVDQRAKQRESERTYALARKEFGLKKADLQLARQKTRAQIKADSQKNSAQKIVARIYASADKAKARAQIRVAKLQLQKGKIDQHQYNTIKNIYEGLPDKGGSKGKSGNGSGPGGSLAPWERDKVDMAVRQFGGGGLTPADRQRAIDTAVKHGIPARLARIAWRRYIKHYHGGSNTNSGRPATPGGRPGTAGNPNVG